MHRTLSIGPGKRATDPQGMRLVLVRTPQSAWVLRHTVTAVMPEWDEFLVAKRILDTAGLVGLNGDHR